MIRFRSPLLLVLLGCLCFSGLAVAAPRWVRVSPTSDPARSMYISWNTDGSGDSRVQYGPNITYGFEQSGAEESVGGDIGVVHTVELTALDPDTTYHYRVGNDTDGWSQDFTFITAPSDVCTPFSFGVAADNRDNFSGSSMCWPVVYQQIFDEGVDFVINSGDLVREGQNDYEWADFMNTSEAFMNRVAIVPAIGNHDDDSVEGDGALYNQIFALPRNSATNTEDFFSFDYGNVHFACLSTSSFDFQTQYDWLAQDLAATDKMWKVVFFHVPFYSSGEHGSNEDGKTWGYLPLFDQHHVDLVITGHDHIYERYHPMFNHQQVASYDQGTCYMVSGGGGAAMDPLYLFRAKEDGLAWGEALHHFVKITISNNVMHVRTQRVSGLGCLQGGQGIADEFDIVKTLASDPCLAADEDSDGHSPPADCDDHDASIHPGAEDVCGDGIDQNCDGQDQPCPCDDLDADGYPAATCGGADCDDADPAIKPGAIEICGDAVDQDCDGQTDEADCQLCTDADGDGRPAVDPACPDGDDCDDGDSSIYPGAHEWCNGHDDNCDDVVDEGGVCDTCQDIDGDGHDGLTSGCASGTDCDDGDAGVHPGASEACNQQDDDCDGLTDEDEVCGVTCVDADHDGYIRAGADCPAGDDCDDGDADIHPGAAESCNGRDDDCDGLTDEDLGVTACGVGVCANAVQACLDGQPQQCEPGQPTEVREVNCTDGQDNDCDGWVDDQDPDCGKASGCGCGASTGDDRSGLWWLLLLGVGLVARRARRFER